MTRCLALALALSLLVGCGSSSAPSPGATSAQTYVQTKTVSTFTAALPTPTSAATNTPAPPAPTPTLSPEPTPRVSYNAPGDHVVQVISGQQNRSFKLHVPPSYQPDTPMPLVIELHGRGSTAFEQEKLSQMSAKADEEGFVVVYPQALGAPPTWHTGGGLQAIADVSFLRDLIDFLEERMSIDPARIYASGFSNGGGMANRLGCDLAGRLAAIASVSGAYVLGGTCRADRPLPVVAFHGTSDEIVPYTGGSVLPPIEDWAAGWAARNGCDPRPTVIHQQGDAIGRTWQSCDMDATVTLYSIEGGGHIWPGSSLAQLFDQDSQGVAATDVIWDFFEAHSLP